MGNINCCKKPDEQKIDNDIINNPEDINQLDTDGFPQDSVKRSDELNNQNEEEIKPLPNNEEIEPNSAENNQNENEEENQNEEQEQEQKDEEEQKDENIEDAAKKSYEQEANAAKRRRRK